MIWPSSQTVVAGPPQARYSRYSGQASSNLFDWSPLATVTSNGGSLSFTDPQPKDAARFYQAALIP